MIVSVVLEKPLGENAEGTVIQCEQEIADSLTAAGIARLATDEDLGAGDESTEDVADPQPDLNQLKRHVEDTVEKAVAKVRAEQNAKATPRPNLKAGYEPTDRNATKGGFNKFGDYLLCEIARQNGDPSAQRKMADYERGRTKGQMSVGVAGAGGSLVPQEWAGELFRLAFDKVPDLMGECTRIPMSHQTVNLPGIVQPNATSGVSANVYAEAGQIVDTVAATSNVQLTLKKFAVLVNVTDELSRFNAYALESVIKQIVPERIRYRLNDDIVRGTNGGVNLIGNAATVAVNRAAANRISYDDVNKMEAALWDSYGDSYCWLTNRGTMPELRRLAFPSTTGNFPIPVFLPGDGGTFGAMTAKPAGTLLGRPIYTVENCSVLGAKGDLIAVHLPSLYAGYLEMDAQMTPYLYFDRAISSFRFLLYASTANALTVPYVRQNGGGSASNIAVLDVPAA